MLTAAGSSTLLTFKEIISNKSNSTLTLMRPIPTTDSTVELVSPTESKIVNPEWLAMRGGAAEEVCVICTMLWSWGPFDSWGAAEAAVKMTWPIGYLGVVVSKRLPSLSQAAVDGLFAMFSPSGKKQ